MGGRILVVVGRVEGAASKLTARHRRLSVPDRAVSRLPLRRYRLPAD